MDFHDFLRFSQAKIDDDGDDDDNDDDDDAASFSSIRRGGSLPAWGRGGVKPLPRDWGLGFTRM